MTNGESTNPRDDSTNRAAPRLPSVRELRRAAEALAGVDDAADHWILVQLNSESPTVRADVFDSEAQATNVRDTRAARGEAWAIVPGRGEEPEVSSTAGQEPFFCILHGERSPMALEVYRDVDRRSIRSIELAVHSEDAGTARTVLVPLPELDIDGRPVGKPDALFFSVEALDKYLFPHLVSVYGVDGASAFRASVLESLRRSFPDPDYRVLV